MVGGPVGQTAPMRNVRGVTVGLVTLALLAACSGADDGGSADADGGATEDVAESAAVEPELFGEGDGDFYAVPDPLPAGEHGDLLRYQEMASSSPEFASWRIMYLSESLQGEPIAVTGFALVPTTPTPAEGRTAVAVAHGTTGIADECAPSKEPGVYGNVAAVSGEVKPVLAFSDFEGLGTPGRHPYLVGESEGRGTLDALKASRQLPDAEIGDRYAIWGYSQGGHAAMFAHQLAAEWGPDDMDLVGTVAGAPATEMSVIFQAAGSQPGIAGFLYMIIAGFEAAYPEADPSLLLTPAGLDLLDAVDEGCGGALAGAAARPPDELLLPGYTEAEPWPELMEANNPGEVATDDPLLILHSAADDLVPAALSQITFDRLCGLGQVVERRVYEDGKGHGAAATDAAVDGFAWIDDLFNGAEPISTCP